MQQRYVQRPSYNNAWYVDRLSPNFVLCTFLKTNKNVVHRTNSLVSRAWIDGLLLFSSSSSNSNDTHTEMDRVLSIQASRRFGHDSETFITKRMCFSFLFSIGFLTLLGGFLLGRYSLDRELEIKKRHLDFERHAHNTRHGSYVDALEHFSDALQNLTAAMGGGDDATSNTVLDANETAALWQILQCRHEITVDKYRGDVKAGVEGILSGKLNSLTDCLRRGLAYVLSRK